MPVTELPDIVPTRGRITELPDIPPVSFDHQTRRAEQQGALRAELEQVRGQDRMARLGANVLPPLEQILQNVQRPDVMLSDLAIRASKGIGTLPESYPLQSQTISPGESVFGSTRPFVSSFVTGKPGTVGAGLEQLGTQTLDALTSREMLYTLPAFGGSGTALNPLLPQAAKAAFAIPMVGHLPGQVENAYNIVTNPDANLEQKTIAVGEPAIGAGFVGLLSKTPRATPGSGITPQDFPFTDRLNPEGINVRPTTSSTPIIGGEPQPIPFELRPDIIQRAIEPKPPEIVEANQALTRPNRDAEIAALEEQIADAIFEKDRLPLEAQLNAILAERQAYVPTGRDAKGRILKRKADVAPEFKQPPAQSGPFTPEQLDAILARGSEWLRANPEIYARVKQQLRTAKAADEQGGSIQTPKDLPPTTGQPRSPVELPLPQGSVEVPPKAGAVFNDKGQLLNRETVQYTQASVDKPAKFISEQGETAIVTKTPSPGVYDADRSQTTGNWRVTYFSPAKEVLGHSEHDTWLQAMSDVGNTGPMSSISKRKWNETSFTKEVPKALEYEQARLAQDTSPEAKAKFQAMEAENKKNQGIEAMRAEMEQSGIKPKEVKKTQFRKRGENEGLIEYVKAKREAGFLAEAKPYEQSIEELTRITDENRSRMLKAQLEKNENAYTYFKALVRKGEDTMRAEIAGLRVKEGMEHGQKRRGETGAILPEGSEGDLQRFYKKFKQDLEKGTEELSLRGTGTIADRFNRSVGDDLAQHVRNAVEHIDQQSDGSVIITVDNYFHNTRQGKIVLDRLAHEGIRVSFQDRNFSPGKSRLRLNLQEAAIELNKDFQKKASAETAGLRIKEGLKRGQERRSETGAFLPKGDEGRKILQKFHDEHGPMAASALLDNNKQHNKALPFLAEFAKDAQIVRAGNNIVLKFKSPEKAKQEFTELSDSYGEGEIRLSGSDIIASIKSTLEIDGYDTQPFLLGDMDVTGELSNMFAKSDAQQKYQKSEGFYTEQPQKLFDDLLKLDRPENKADTAPEFKEPGMQSGPFTPEQLDRLLSRGVEWLKKNPSIYRRVQTNVEALMRTDPEKGRPLQIKLSDMERARLGEKRFVSEKGNQAYRDFMKKRGEAQQEAISYEYNKQLEAWVEQGGRVEDFRYNDPSRTDLPPVSRPMYKERFTTPEERQREIEKFKNQEPILSEDLTASGAPKQREPRPGIRINIEAARRRRRETGAVFPEGSEGKPESFEDFIKKIEAELEAKDKDPNNLTPEDFIKIQNKLSQPIKHELISAAELKQRLSPLPKRKSGIPDYINLLPFKELRQEYKDLYRWVVTDLGKSKGAFTPDELLKIERIEELDKFAQQLAKQKEAGLPQGRGLLPGRHLDKPGFGMEAGGGKLHTMVGEAIEQAYGKGKDLVANLKEWSKGAKDTPLAKFLLDPVNKELPDIIENSNEVFSQGFGTEKILVLGRVLGGKAKIRSEQDKALAAWHVTFHGVAKSVAAHLGEQIKGKINKVFTSTSTGELNVKPTSPNQSLYAADVFEALKKDPNAYILTPAQRLIYDNELVPRLARMQTLALKYRIMNLLDDSGDFRPWFPRIITKHPEVQTGSMGPVQPRKFSTEREGWERGYEFETDLEKRMVTGTQRLYRAIANKRLADDPAVRPNSMEALRDQLKMLFTEELDSGAMTQAQVDRMAEGHQPIPMRGMFPPHIAKLLEKEFASEHSKWRRGLVEVNSVMKASLLGFDVGGGMIQGQVLMLRDPKMWGRTQLEAWKALANPEYWLGYIRKPENKAAANDLSQLGISVGSVAEHLSGLTDSVLQRVPRKVGKAVGGAVEKVGEAAGYPKVGKVVGKITEGVIKSPASLGAAYARHFQTSLDVAKIELWKAQKPFTDPKDLPALARSIEAMTLTERLQPNMISSNRALTEQAFFMAPAYYRGALNLVAGALPERLGGARGNPGKQMRRSIGHLVGAGMVMYLAVAKMLNMSNDEILKRLDPRRADFMAWKVQEGERVTNVGFGGIYRSVFRLMGNVYKTLKTEPGNFFSFSPQKNPLVRWYRGHAGPAPGMGITAVSDKDFLGRDADVVDIAKSTLPITGQAIFQNPEEGKVTKTELIGSQLGLITMPESRTAAKERLQEFEAKLQYNKKFKDLDINERYRIAPLVKERLDRLPSGMSKERAQMLAMQFANKRHEKLRKDIGEDKWLKANKLELPSYSLRRSYGGEAIVLTEAEQEILHQNMLKHYREEIAYVKKRKDITQEDLNKYIGVAKTRAWIDTMDVIGQQGELAPKE